MMQNTRTQKIIFTTIMIKSLKTTIIITTMANVSAAMTIMSTTTTMAHVLAAMNITITRIIMRRMNTTAKRVHTM